MELLRQIANLLQEGQISLAAVHAYNNKVDDSFMRSLERYVSGKTFSEFQQLVGELNGRADD